MTKKVFISILVVLLACTAVFASGAQEKLVDFQSVNMETESIENIQKTWNSAVDFYNESVESLQKAMAEAYAERNAKEYTECRELLRTLVAPKVTEEQTQTLMARIENAADEEKDAIVSFLSSNSLFYRAPRVTFSYQYEDSNRKQSFQSSVSRKPGDVFSAPSCQGEGNFLGWGTEDGEVLYQEGDEITMPYSDVTYYAVFQNGIRFVDPVSDTEEFVAGTSAALPLVEDQDGYYFAGWYDRMGNLQEDAVTIEEGRNATFTAGWEGLEIDAVEAASVPAGKRMRLSFSLNSTGNVSVKDLEVTLESVEGLEIKGDATLKAKRLGAYSHLRGSYEIVVTGEKDQIIETTLTVKDADGHEWSQPIVFTVK